MKREIESSHCRHDLQQPLRGRSFGSLVERIDCDPNEQVHGSRVPTMEYQSHGRAQIVPGEGLRFAANRPAHNCDSPQTVLAQMEQCREIRLEDF
jgi:hypothetical protein